MTDQTKDEIRICALEKSVDKIDIRLEKIENNHLFHIQTDLSGVKSDISWIKTAMYVFYYGIIIALIGLFIKFYL